MQQFTCQCCKQTIETESHRPDTLGWIWVVMIDGGSRYLCPDCGETAAALVRHLVQMIGSSQFYIHRLLPKEERIKHP
jgi:predicted RNA-binding Zn-ribbon protein involved in translation (DUF1610 family)